MPMPASRLLFLLDALSEANVPFWLDGGWGVDALLGEQSRDHDDADLVVPLAAVAAVAATLGTHGFTIGEDWLPTRLVLRSRAGEQVDLHPVTFDEAGHGRQANAAPDGSDCLYPADQFTAGTINGRDVPCVGPLVQLDHHSGYVPRPHDVQDMKRLTDKFGQMLDDYPST